MQNNQDNRENTFNQNKQGPRWEFRNDHIMSVIVVAIVFMGILSSYLLMSSNSCTEMYKISKCWEASKSLDSECLKLSKCIEEEGSAPYREEIMATLAGLIFIIKKYWREILDLARRIHR